MNKKTKELSVRLHGIEIGILKLINGKMQFQYNDDIEFPISLSMPIQNEPFKNLSSKLFNEL